MSEKATNNKTKHIPPQRRSKATADLQHLIPGGQSMTDTELELTLDWVMRPRS